jgi:hypothetical protein
MPQFRPIHATLGGDCKSMTAMIHTIAIEPHIPPGDLPETPDDIDLDRIVTDPEYRRTVQDLLRRWGICDKRSNARDTRRSG